MTPPPADDERFEHIPWEQLAPAGDRTKVMMYAVAGAIGVAALTAALVRGGGQADLVSPPSTVTSPTAAVTTPLEATPSPPASSTTLASADDEDDRPWSEADLMAFPPESLAFQAASLAEWLASDFFTVDGGTGIAEALADVLPEGSAVPAARPGSRSYVEWARAMSVDESQPGVYEALVLVRRLGAAEGEDYRRMPPVAVTITLAWTDQGWSVADLPMLAAAPVLVQRPEWSAADVPDAVTATIEASTGGVVTGGTQIGDTWRVVVAIDDPAGVSWPLVIWSDAAGNRIPLPGRPGQP